MIFNNLPLYAIFTEFGKRKQLMKVGAMKAVDMFDKTHIIYPEDVVFSKGEPIPRYMVAQDVRLHSNTEVLVMHNSIRMSFREAVEMYGRLVHVHVI